MFNYQSFIAKCNANIKSDGENCVDAYKYLTNDRKITDKTIKDFGIGYCVAGQKELYDDERFKKSINSIANRIVVPICSEFGSIVAFATREPSIDSSGWWNTWFDKMNHLFMLNMAKKHMFAADKVYLCEGYFDSITCWQNGIKNVCALMSTTLGYRRIGLLARYCSHVCLCFDSDKESKAGQNAQKKAIYEMYKYGWENISVVTLPDGQDPDDFIAHNGKRAFYDMEKKLDGKTIANIAHQYEVKNKNRAKRT
jgi:DNA primase